MSLEKKNYEEESLAKGIFSTLFVLGLSIGAIVGMTVLVDTAIEQFGYPLFQGQEMVRNDVAGILSNPEGAGQALLTVALFLIFGSFLINTHRKKAL